MNRSAFFKNLFSIAIIFIHLPLMLSCDKDEDKKPTCTIVNPLSDTAFEKGEIINITVEANDPDGKISQVDIYLNGEFHGFTNSLGWTYSLSTSDLVIGSHVIKAEVVDEDGNVASDEIVISITKPINHYGRYMHSNGMSGYLEFFENGTVHFGNASNGSYVDGDYEMLSSHEVKINIGYLGTGTFSEFFDTLHTVYGNNTWIKE